MKLLWLFLPLWLIAKEISLDFLISKPRSQARDYYIWRFLDQNITPQEAQKALELTKRVNSKILRRYAQKIEDNAIKRAIDCLYMPAKKLINQDPSCIAAGINIAKFSKLSRKKRIKLFAKLQQFPIKDKLKFLLSPNPSLTLQFYPKEFLYIFLASGKSFRKKHFNKAYSKKFLLQLTKNYRFNSFAIKAVFEKLDKTVYSLLRLPPKLFNAQAAFYLGVAALQKKLPHIAQDFFLHSYTKAYYQNQKDRALFWLYKTTHDKTYLQKLLNSKDCNIYLLLAYELMQKSFTNFTHLSTFASKTIDLNLSDPFIWYETYNKISSQDPNKLLREFNASNTANLYAIVYEKAHHYQKHPFITPYEKELRRISFKPLLYAIIRQESRFIPGAISSSYALGITQFMPFLAKHMAKRVGIKDFDLDMMFEEKIALQFGMKHLRYLKKYLLHPLFVAYAYNGGIGYLKRRVIPLFKRYSDPLMAMEFIPSTENREYGKKVLTNLAIYNKIFHKSFSLLHSLQKLKQPALLHRFGK